MGTGDATATATQVKLLVKTGKSDSDITDLLDDIVYEIVNTWIGGDGNVTSGVRAACEAMVGAYFIKKSDPVSMALPNTNLTFSNFTEVKNLAMEIINLNRDEDNIIRCIDGVDRYGSSYRLTNNKWRNPPF